jgi:hypothetical protein
MRRFLTAVLHVALLVAGLAACSDDGAATSAGPGGDGGEGGGAQTDPPCAVSETLAADGSCCAAGTLPMAEGGCLEPGIPADACADGFAPDEAQGCTAVLPSAPCPAGELATPGDTSCHPLMPCGMGPWGDIPVDGSTQYVDGSFVGASDGTLTSPWTTIAEGVSAVADGGIVAIAAGQYDEDVLSQRNVRLLGRCPSMVRIVGQGSEIGAVSMNGGGELDGVSVTGPANGVLGIGALRVSRVHVHDTGSRGIYVYADMGATRATRATLEGVLVDSVARIGVGAHNAELHIIDSVIRDTRASTSGLARSLSYTSDDTGSSGSVVGSVLTRAQGLAVSIGGASDVTLRATLVSDTLPDVQGKYTAHRICQQNWYKGDRNQMQMDRRFVIHRILDGDVFTVQGRGAPAV